MSDASKLKPVRLGIDTYQEPVVYMRRDCDICRSEGFEAQSRIRIQNGGHSVIATLNVIDEDAPFLGPGEAGLSEAAWRLLEIEDSAELTLTHPKPLRSLSLVREKVYGHQLSAESIHNIMSDIAAGRYSDVQLSSFITACVASRMTLDEIVHLTNSMVAVGDRLDWSTTPVVDKHCVGGLPGNRTTMIVVPIVASHGLTMPKTSSRAITSPAGTADAMETIAPVTLGIDEIRRVVDREGGCIVWGGAVRLSPADDILIRVERALDIDSEGQLIASVLSKKVAAGSTHVVIDVPVGPTAKVRDDMAAELLAHRLVEVGRETGLQVAVVLSDGTQPVGRGIGPALEARDVLNVLAGKPDAPQDLADRAVVLAGRILELANKAPLGEGELVARRTLEDGTARKKLEAICEAQGGMTEIPQAKHTRIVAAPRDGRVTAIDNRRLAQTAKLAGAPRDAAAGLDLHVRLDERVERGQPLFTLHAESKGELEYASAYLDDAPAPFTIEEPN